MQAHQRGSQSRMGGPSNAAPGGDHGVRSEDLFPKQQVLRESGGEPDQKNGGGGNGNQIDGPWMVTAAGNVEMAGAGLIAIRSDTHDRLPSQMPTGQFHLSTASSPRR